MDFDEPQPPDEKLLTLGKLARGIAHDLKNLLAGIQGNTELALRDYENEKATRKALASVMLAARSAHELAEQISAYSREDEIPTKVLDMRDAIRQAKGLIGPFLTPEVSFNIDMPEQELCVRANASQLQQLVLNLCHNSLHALSKDGGQLIVHLEAIGGDKLGLTVYDTGSGISPDILPRIFDPFFTTKELGFGTGLGLALVKRIVNELGGSIEAQSEVGVSTTFKVVLPRCNESPEKEEPLPQPEDLRREKKAILLVDDEPIMRGLGMDVLHTLGYRVSVAANGLEALELVEKNPGYFDLVLSDSKMPEMSGPELAEKLHTVHPELPFILVTAFNDAMTEAKLKQLGVKEIVHKPFLIENLQRALNNALSDAPGEASGTPG